MADITLTAGKAETFTVAYVGTLNGGAAQPVNDPAQTTWQSSDSTILAFGTPTGIDTVPVTPVKAGTGTFTVSIPAAQDANFSYTAFTKTFSFQVNPQTVTITDATVTMAP